MHPIGVRGYRAAIVARTRLVEGLLVKRRRLEELGYGLPEHLRLIPVNFEAGDDRWQALLASGFDPAQTALVSSSGVSMYLTAQSTLARLAALALRSVVAMTCMLPFELVDEAERPGLEQAARGARASGTPWISFFAPEEILSLAREASFAHVEYVPTAELAERDLAGRTDGLRAAGGEGILLARTG